MELIKGIAMASNVHSIINAKLVAAINESRPTADDIIKAARGVSPNDHTNYGWLGTNPENYYRLRNGTQPVVGDLQRLPSSQSDESAVLSKIKGEKDA